MSQHRNRRFTLIELVVVITILAIIGGGIILSMEGIQEKAETDAATHQMGQIRQAILHFRSDMMLMPKQGALDRSQLAGAVDSTWFYHPANLDQIFTMPVDVSNSTRWTDAPGKARAWHGVYCTGSVLLDPANPGDLAKLDALMISGSPAASTPTTTVRAILDPWGKPYLYLVPQGTDFNSASLHSYGPDGLLNTSDDLSLEILK